MMTFLIILILAAIGISFFAGFSHGTGQQTKDFGDEIDDEEAEPGSEFSREEIDYWYLNQVDDDDE
jgi:hypothetical protein